MGKGEQVGFIIFGFWFVGLLLLAGIGRDVPSLYLWAPIWAPLALIAVLQVACWVAVAAERVADAIKGRRRHH